MTIIIGLLGPAGSGKSSVANYLVEHYGAKRYALAAPLKEFAMSAFEFTHAQCWGTQAEKEAPDERYGGHSARWFLQRLGTEGFRNTFGQDFWADFLIKRISEEQPALAVVEDVRFVNEAQKILGVNSLTWLDVHSKTHFVRPAGHVWRLEAPSRETQADATHASEAQWRDAPYDFVIAPTERGLDQLFRLVEDTCRHLCLFPVRPELPL